MAQFAIRFLLLSFLRWWSSGFCVNFRVILYKYNILERVLVENIIPRNVIINRGAAEVDNHISRDDIFD